MTKSSFTPPEEQILNLAPQQAGLVQNINLVQSAYAPIAFTL